MNRSIKKTWNIISGILVALAVLLAVLLVGARVIGLQVFSVLSGSMEPDRTLNTCKPITLAPTRSTARSTAKATRMPLMMFQVFLIDRFIGLFSLLPTADSRAPPSETCCAGAFSWSSPLYQNAPSKAGKCGIFKTYHKKDTEV